MALSLRFKEDFDTYVKEAGSRTLASVKANSDITKISLLGKGILLSGKMYAFEYFTEDEDFFDMFPVVLGLGRSNDGNQLGLNLHYLPMNVRVAFIQDLTDTVYFHIKEQTNGKKLGNPKNQMQMNFFTWDNLKFTYGKKYNLKPCIKQYRLDRIKKMYQIGYEHWYIGTAHNQNYFYGGNISLAQSFYYSNI